ncbi:MAG TPA: exodeoxyribonuclease VII large subunit, partial [Bacillota bacterium]|nr:exodeoxyribonuclease VII large subunit [Bacillota bacterium]
KIQTCRQEVLKLTRSRGLLYPRQTLDQRRQEIDYLLERMTRTLKQNLVLERERYGKIIGKLDTLSPLATLQRGYTIAQKTDGVVMKSADQVQSGERFKLILAQGKLDCQVISKEP